MAGNSHSLDRKTSQRKSPKVPGYLYHKGTGQARVRLNGVDHYLGPYGSEKSRIRYGELIAEYSAGLSVDPFRPAHPQQAGGGLTVNELALAFMRHAATFNLKHGEPTSEIACFKLAIRPLVELYGFTPVEQFGPLAYQKIL